MMRIFNIFKEKERGKGRVLLSMPIFNREDAYILDLVVSDLKKYWKLHITDLEGDDETATFRVNNLQVGLAKIPFPIPAQDIKDIIPYSYLWENVTEECLTHTSHALVTVLLNCKQSILEGYKILTQLNTSILRSSNAIGIYQGGQTLLLPKSLYLNYANLLLENQLPVHLWLYIGIVNNNKKNSIYTFGLEEFGKKEIEIIDTTITGKELYDFIIPLITFVLKYNVIFKNGDTITYEDNQKIKISQSKGIFIKGKTLKLQSNTFG